MPRPMASARLEAVSETLLWTLYHRATEARRRDAVLRDPKAVELIETIDFPSRSGSGPRGRVGRNGRRSAPFASTARSSPSSARLLGPDQPG